MNNKVFIIELLLDLEKKIEYIRKLYAGKNIGFMLGSTVSKNPKQLPYVTPIRIYENIAIIGAVVFNQIDAIIIASKLGEIVDKFYVDVEKKLPIDLIPNYKLANEYVPNLLNNFEHAGPELGNISQAIRGLVNESKLIPYKANDITVEAVWSFVSLYVGELSRKKILIVGLGNIGSKLALKFVESGASIQVYGINSYKDNLIVNALNAIKNKAVLANVILSESIEFSSLQSDVIILSTSNKNNFNINHARCSTSCKLIVDVGKGAITEEAIEFLSSIRIPIWRADVTDYLPLLLNMKPIFSNNILVKFGSKNIGEYTIISGGWIGKAGDIVVDNFAKPNLIYGICDGKGGFLVKNNEYLLSLLSNIKKLFK